MNPACAPGGRTRHEHSRIRVSDSETDRASEDLMRSLPRSHGTGEKDFPSQVPGRARAGAGGGLCAPPPAPAPVRASGSASSYVLGRRSLARNAAIRRSRPPRGWLPNEILMIESGLLLWENGGTDGPAESEIGPSKPLLDCGLRGVVVRLRRINRLWLWHFDIDTQAVFYGW